MPASSTTGDIVWKWQEPKTVELYNVNPEPPPEPEQEAKPELDPRELELLKQMMVAESQQGYQLPTGGRNMPDEEKRDARKQIRTFLRSMRDPSGKYDPNQGIQEMIDSGAIVYDEDGLWTALPHMNKRDQQRLIGMADAWADEVGLWKGQNFVPERYKPYGSPEQKEWSQRRYEYQQESQQRWEEAMRYPEEARRRSEPAPAVREEPTIGTEELKQSIRGDIEAAKQLGLREPSEE